MAFGSVTLVPGVNAERTPTTLRAGFLTSAFIRFKDSLVQKLGGWTKFTAFAVSGTPRDLHAWQDLNEADHLAIGTTTRLSVLTNNVLQDITPQALVSDFAPGAHFSTTSGSKTVAITDPNVTNITVQDSVFFNTPIWVGGLVLSGLYPITLITGPSSYQIQAAKAATSTTAISFVPSFTTVLGVNSVNVQIAAHGLAVGDTIVFQIPTTANGVTIDGAYQVNAVTDVNNFAITVTTQATAAGVFNMNGSQAELVYWIALGPNPAGAGFGLGGFGLGGFGTGVNPGNQVGAEITATDWTSDNWGEILIACPQDGPIFFWDPTSGFQNAQIISGGPVFNKGIFISQTQQILVAFGSSVAQDIGIQEQSLLVQWSDVGNFLEWTASSATQAGNFPIPNGSKLIAGLAGPNQNLLWTDLDLWAMNYIGPPTVFGFNKIGAGLGAVSSHAVQQLRGSTFWMAPTNFCSYTGGGANVIPCPIWDAVFQNINTAFLRNVRSMPNTPFNEVGWLFPSVNSSNGECDSYAKFNITEPGAPWDYCIGGMPRSAWTDQSVLGMPIGATPNGTIYQHEVSPDADGGPVLATFTTGYFYLAEGEEFCFVDQLIPDFRWSIFPGGASAQIQLTFNVVNYPGDTPTVFGPYTVTQATEYISLRFRGRLMSITAASADIGSFWRLGSCKYRYAPSGRR